jgi:hypothetical protein
LDNIVGVKTIRPLLVLLAGALMIQVISCATEPEPSGGIFGDRPIERPEEERDASSSDATADTSADDASNDGDAGAPPDAADSS